MEDRKFSVHEGEDYIYIYADKGGDGSSNHVAQVYNRELADRMVLCLNATEGIPNDILKVHCTGREGFMTLLAKMVEKNNDLQSRLDQSEKTLGKLAALQDRNATLLLDTTEALHKTEKIRKNLIEALREDDWRCGCGHCGEEVELIIKEAEEEGKKNLKKEKSNEI